MLLPRVTVGIHIVWQRMTKFCEGPNMFRRGQVLDFRDRRGSSPLRTFCVMVVVDRGWRLMLTYRDILLIMDGRASQYWGRGTHSVRAVFVKWHSGALI